MECIKIQLLSDMCAGSGASAGNSIDTDICMDNVGLPYIPARRIKGCLRQSAMDLMNMGYPQATQENIDKLFGNAYGEEGLFSIHNAYMLGHAEMKSFLMSKSKGWKDSIAKEATPDNIVKLFTTVRGQTSLQEGVKVDGSLRTTRVLNQYDPFSLEDDRALEFYATLFVDKLNKELRDLLESCCKATRHIGTNRNRGLGNVKFSIESKEHTPIESEVMEGLVDGQVLVEYRIVLEAPLTLPGCGETNTLIPARSVIGCLASHYLKSGSADDPEFRDLFLNGTAKWSNLTPVIDGEISSPSPFYFMKLKNDGGKLINQLAMQGKEWKKMKPKTIEGSYVSLIGGNEYHVASVNIQTTYHNSIAGSQLYMQDYIDAGLIYGGNVIVDAKYASLISELLTKAKLSFGRSKAAQYASCMLIQEPVITAYNVADLNVQKGDIFAVTLKSDMILDDGCYELTQSDVRSMLANELKVSVEQPDEYEDHYVINTISGFQTRWNMQKPHIPAIGAGSVFFFIAGENSIPSNMNIGEYQQEGFGVCEIQSVETLKNISDVKSSYVDENIVEDKQRIEMLKSLLLVNVATEALKRYAKEIKVHKDVPTGRLRLMLNEAKDLNDLIKRVETMKTSDESSEKEKGKKKRSLELIESVYGKTVFEQISKVETDIFEELTADKAAYRALEKRWKEVLSIVLHNAHYQKGGNQ